MRNMFDDFDLDIQKSTATTGISVMRWSHFEECDWETTKTYESDCACTNVGSQCFYSDCCASDACTAVNCYTRDSCGAKECQMGYVGYNG